jgi:hypothetical protein
MNIFEHTSNHDDNLSITCMDSNLIRIFNDVIRSSMHTDDKLHLDCSVMILTS